MTEPAIVLGPNQYGKAEVRVVKVTRDTARHEIDDLNVTSQLRGDFAAAHLAGDNAHVVATDTQKNTIFAFARDGIGTPEAFLLRLADHFTGAFDWVSGGRWEAERFAWQRIRVGDAEHDHAFVRSGEEVRTALVIADGVERHVIAGLKELTVLKTTESGFEGYPKDRYTTLPETRDRILATDVAARWRYVRTEVDYDSTYASVRACSWRRSPRSIPRPCRRRSSTWAAACSSATPRSRRSASRCRTSTTSWSTSRPSASTTRTRCSSRPTGPTA